MDGVAGGLLVAVVALLLFLCALPFTGWLP